MPDAIAFERRQHARSPVVRTCKIRPAGALRYDGGTTEDASWGGICVNLRTARRFVEGDTVELVVAWDDEAVAQMPATKARIRRAIDAGASGQRLALEFIREDAVSAEDTCAA